MQVCFFTRWSLSVEAASCGRRAQSAFAKNSLFFVSEIVSLTDILHILFYLLMNALMFSYVTGTDALR